MAGALAERAFAEKLQRAGFAQVSISERCALGIDDVAAYPLFTAELVALMRRAIPASQHDCVATSVIARARKARG